MYYSLENCVEDLRRTGQLIDIASEVDPYLEMAEIHRQVYQASGPAIFYAKVKGSPFPAISNLYGTPERMQFIFRKTLGSLEFVTKLKSNPVKVLSHPEKWPGLLKTLWNIRPQKKSQKNEGWLEGKVSMLPQIVSWPGDGGAFITLPQVYTENPAQPGWRYSNLGMYRIQISGGEYIQDKEIGLHYQIHRGIGHHHSLALERGESLKVSIFIGGPPGHGFAAVMPMPEGMPEVSFAGALSGRRFAYSIQEGFVLSDLADFCITGTISPGKLKPEGPFGDHLGYYSLAHDYPVLDVDKVYYKNNSIFPFTVVGRPPQEDSEFGRMIHHLTGSLVKDEIPGVKEIRAVDEAGVHPLMLAVAKERYVPWQKQKPMETLTVANAILGYGQCSLAKYLFISADNPEASLSVKNIKAFFTYCLERINFERDLHFITQTTMDTLDYSGDEPNVGSKLILAAAGDKRRELSSETPEGIKLPGGFSKPVSCAPGILCITGPAFEDFSKGEKAMQEFSDFFAGSDTLDFYPLIVISDDSEFAGKSFENFLWVTFTRSNPARDVYGVESFVLYKHWGCKKSLIIDARRKPHHAPGLLEDEEIFKKVSQRKELSSILS